ncbi:hypothetical protein EDD17DRAFT_1503166 [Pisolithus thermaeus]|nr:hypothetical protein EV401DRAFT_1895617 [Pisolithus croceorrhizus]KAI6168268.1 hypothetical protein EDD17DRAFT_1503166 [Pisolithus thermaeus]
MDMVHMLGPLHEYETPRRYGVRDFLRITRAQLAVTIITCHLYHIPSRSSCWHEFLLVSSKRVDYHVIVHNVMAFTAERLVFIIERVPTNNGVQIMSSNGGVARDTITVVRAREHHEYWQSAGRNLVCKGMLQWHQPLPRLFDITFMCYFYARITLDAMAKAFPSCSRHGTMLFSRGWFAVLGSYKPSQVQLLIDLHTIGCQGVVPAIETERHASHLVTGDILHGLAMSVTSFQGLLHVAATHQEEYPSPAASFHHFSDCFELCDAIYTDPIRISPMQMRLGGNGIP